ncbi:NAD-dependent succinate-semialdehyde dehydrogenase [Klebsiella variicola]|uniref:NAD-dependent succinate-semialdehyde dehydrogenase n=1 Tax=Klebsiella variicola TaxID=244366 RepID=UPI002FFB207B
MNLFQSPLFHQECLINGQWCAGDTGEYDDIYNPANGERIGYVPQITAEQTLQAIAAADIALDSWRRLTGMSRAALLLRWAELILEHHESLAQILSSEQGKPLSESRGEIIYAASFVTWNAEEAKRVEGHILTPTKPDQKLMVIRQPVGVCAAITPWNFPAAMITRKVAPALAAGCTMVLKPAEQTPFTALALAELSQRAGFPAGVFQVITGQAQQVGKVLCESTVVRKLSFTGSTEVGRILMAQCSGTIKKMSLELGGNAPFIVFDDADPEAAVEGIMASKFRNSGQTCVCANRIYIQQGIYAEIKERLVDAVEKLVVGDAFLPGVTQGPLIDEQAVQKVTTHIKDALSAGATLLTGGHVHSLGGRYFQPTVIADVTAEMLFSREETFGPVAPLFCFEHEDEVTEMANNTEYGLAAYVYTKDAGRQWRMSDALEYGMVGINTGIISNEVSPFGGIKQSGLGREGSRFGLDEYLEMKYICIATGQ